jgi:dihydrofolate synthase / folylpolyglutamate synthase
MSQFTYKETLDYIYGFVDYEKLPGASPKRMNLDRIRALVDGLDHPEHHWPAVHIAGTKGKGSTASMLASIVQQSGYRVGLYTSPHLVSVRERIVVNGIPISEEDVSQLVDKMRPVIEHTHQSSDGFASSFDIMTALAFLFFKEQHVDLAVIESGLGGRLDSTNIIEPIVCAITPIGLDHTDRLGKTIPEITREKSGIIKRGVPIVSAPQTPDARAIINEVCKSQESTLYEVGTDIHYTIQGENTEQQMFDIRGRKQTYQQLTMPLLGEYQACNAATAVGVVELLTKMGFQISPDNINRGLKEVHLPGRVQVLEHQPWLILDGAHNVLAAENLTRTLQRLFPCRRSVLVLSIHQDKAVDELCRVFASYADEIIVTARRVLRKRQADPDKVAALCRQMGTPVRVASTVSNALEMARAITTPYDTICVTGSFALVGETMEVLQNLEPEETLSR